VLERPALRKIVRNRWRRFEPACFHRPFGFRHQAIHGQRGIFDHHPSGQLLPFPGGQPPHFALDFRYVHPPMTTPSPAARQVAEAAMAAKEYRFPFAAVVERP